MIKLNTKHNLNVENMTKFVGLTNYVITKSATAPMQHFVKIQIKIWQQFVAKQERLIGETDLLQRSQRASRLSYNCVVSDY